jgi:hypothetical protein
MCDASVHFLNEEMDQSLYFSLASRNGEEVVDNADLTGQ